MGLLKDFLRIDADRRAAHAALRRESESGRLRIEELGAEAKRKRDEIGVLEEELRRLAEDVARAEEAILAVEARRDGHEREAHERKVDAVRSVLAHDRADGHRVAEDFRRLRSAFEAQRARLLAEVIRHHHERLDGKGYPDGLRGEEIPLIARIFAVVDVFDALTSERSYKSPMGLDEAMQIILHESGSHFDPRIATAFMDIAPALYVTITQAETNELRQRLHEVLLRYFKLGVLPPVV